MYDEACVIFMHVPNYPFQEEAQAKFKAEMVPKLLKYIANMLQPSGYLIGSKVCTLHVGTI